MVAFVNDHLAVSCHPIVHAVLAGDALEHGYIEQPCRLLLPAANLPDRRLLDPEEHRELHLPLIQERPPVDEHQGAAPALGREVDTEHGLPHAGGSDEHAGVMLEEGLGGVFLEGGQLSVEMDVEGVAVRALIVDGETHPILVEEGLEIGATPSRQREVLGELLGTGDHAGSQGGGQSHPLFLVEFRVLEGRQTLDLVEQRGGEIGLRNEKALG